MKPMEISFFFEDIERFKIDENIQSAIEKACADEKKSPGNINFIFCSDIYLLDMNKEYLKHDYFTDIITFDYSEGNMISGDIFISRDRVEDNAETYRVSFDNELNRVMIHGILHLLGYKDETPEEKKHMRETEDKYINT
jgi:rRNA maturation RNase YbeY